MSEIDWKSELRKVEREFEGLPPEPTAADLRRWRETEAREERRRQETNAVFGAWSRLLLVVGMTAALWFWPYPRACGRELYTFLAAESVVVAGALWVMTYSWSRRTGRAHSAAILLLLTGVALLAMQVLPRVGYARVDAAHPPRWSCAA